jgi:hypothetical protein
LGKMCAIAGQNVAALADAEVLRNPDFAHLRI